MKLLLVFVIYFPASQKCSPKHTDVTLNVKQRVDLLKYQISQQIREQIPNEKMYPMDNHELSGSYEFDDLENKPITPIMDNERKKHGSHRLRELRMTTDKTFHSKKKLRQEVKKGREKKSRADLERSQETEALKLKSIDNYFTTKQMQKEKLKPLRNKAKKVKNTTDDSFYRRIYKGNLDIYCAKERIHCEDLLTPLLTGLKANLTERKLLTYTDNEVTRLIQLLTEDPSDMSKEEIYSILYQISNLQIRLFQWDVPAIKLLFTTLTRHILHKEPMKRHSFKTLKQGLKATLGSWHLDFTNVTNLLKQARLFRPPCVRLNDYEGSTLTSKTFRFTKKVTTKCPPGKKRYSGGRCESTFLRNENY